MSDEKIKVMPSRYNTLKLILAFSICFKPKREVWIFLPLHLFLCAGHGSRSDKNIKFLSEMIVYFRPTCAGWPCSYLTLFQLTKCGALPCTCLSMALVYVVTLESGIWSQNGSLNPTLSDGAISRHFFQNWLAES